MNQHGMNPESRIMNLCRFFGLRKLRWSLRRLHCPVDSSALVLEVGAGGNPYPRANVLLDAEEVSFERAEQDLVTDRPLVLGLMEKLPFKDKSFDFIIAAHVLEHTDRPQDSISELVRVGKAGYIETPHGWFEKMCAYTFHRLEISEENGKLIINKKPNWKPDPIARLYENKLAKNAEWKKFIRLYPDLYHLRFYWNKTIEFEILDDTIDASWDYPEELNSKSVKSENLSSFEKTRRMYLRMLRNLFSQHDRNKKLDVLSLLKCVDCDSESLSKMPEAIVCNKCERKYPIANGVVKMFPSEKIGFVRKN